MSRHLHIAQGLARDTDGTKLAGGGLCRLPEVGSSRVGAGLLQILGGGGRAVKGSWLEGKEGWGWPWPGWPGTDCVSPDKALDTFNLGHGGRVERR